MNRRNFIKLGCGSVLTYSLSPRGGLELAYGESSQPIDVSQPFPIQSLGWHQFSSQDFNGDDIERSHEALWNRDGYIARKGGIPTATETIDTVVIGGGMSGLLAAYLLRDRRPVVLEQAANFGGNSRGESFPDGRPYSIGAAYITRPEEGSLAERVLRDLGMLSTGRGESSTEMKVFFEQQLRQGFWQGETDPSASAQIKAIYERLKSIFESQYPEIPWQPGSGLSRSQFLALDQLSFADWLRQNFSSLHPHVLEYFQLYCWSSFGGSIDEISAAQALNFLAAETAAVIAFPGGNAAIAQALCKKILQTGGANSLRAGHLVLDVSVEGEGVRVCYETPQRELRTLIAKQCIVAAPKFVARKIVTSMPLEQQKACESITYRAYVVANVMVDLRRRKKEGPFSPCFDLYCLEGQAPPTPSALRPPRQAFTDICFGHWAEGDLGEVGVLTVYKALPYDGARQFLFSPLSHSKYRQSMTEGIRELLVTLGIDESAILGLRLTRWGHALPLAERGALAAGFPERASSPIGQRIYFANQDNWVNPSFEVAVAAAAQVVQAMHR